MIMRIKKILLGLSFAAIVGAIGQVQAEIITTLYAGNNGGNLGDAVYFNINVLNPGGITIERLFTNSAYMTSNANISVYTRPGTHVGFEGNIAGWTLASSGFGNLAGLNNPSAFDVTDFFLGQGLTGIAIRSQVGVWSHRYSNGNGFNQFYSNSHLSLTLGSAASIAFTQTVHSQRVWNGAIQYSAVPEPSSFAMICIGAYIVGAGSVRRRR